MRWLLIVATAAAMQLWAGGPVWAEPPLRVDDPVTDRVGALDGDAARVREAIDRLRAANGTQLFVVYVSRFDGMNGQQWSDETARLSQLGDRDVLLAVAVDDRAYGYSVAGEFPLSDSELADLVAQEVEPRLAAGDWAGAAVAMADGLRTGGGAGGDGAAADCRWVRFWSARGSWAEVPCCCGVERRRAGRERPWRAWPGRSPERARHDPDTGTRAAGQHRPHRAR